MRHSFSIIVSAALAAAAALTACRQIQTPEERWDNRPALLDDACLRIESRLGALEADMRAAAAKISSPQVSTNRNLIREGLAVLAEKHPHVFDFSFVDKSGKMLVVEPATHANYEGSDISSQEQVRKVLDQGVPAMSALFMAVEGFHAMDFEIPIKNTDGQTLGAVSALIRPEEFFGTLLVPMCKGTPADVWLMDSAGVMVYDQDTAEIGRHALTDRLYRQFPTLAEAVRTIMSGPDTGFTRYDFLDQGLKKKMRKTAFWRKIRFNGAEWAVAVTVAANPEYISLGWTHSPWAPSENEALRRLASDPALLKAVESDIPTAIQSVLKSHHSEYPCYNIQWITTRNRIVCGYPLADNFAGFDLSAEKNPSDLELINRLDEGKESTFETRLLEGGKGKFHIVPVIKNGRQLGSLLTIDIVSPRPR